MSDSLRLQRKMRKRLYQHLPELSNPQRGNLAWLMTGLHEAEHVHLSKVAGYRVGAATLESKTRQVRRLVANEAIDPQQCYEPLARQLLQSAAESQGRIRILVDGLELSGGRQILMAALAYRRRALPIRWEVRRQEEGGVSGADYQKAFLEALKADIPSDAEIVIVADGEFHATDLMEHVTGQVGWHYHVRLHSDTYLQLPDGEWKQLADLAPEKGKSCYLQDVYVTKKNAYGPVSVALCHDENEDDPWFICTDQTADYLTLRTYSRRMWIEELFGDLEDGGFHLNRSRLYEPKRLSRLLMALAWVYVWLMHVGAWIIKRGLRPMVDRRDRRDRSLAQLGRRWIQRCMTNEKALHLRFRPYF